MLRLLPPLCWTGLIAYLGGSQWGGAHTSAWIIPLLRALLPAVSPEALATLHLVIRKCAHVLDCAAAGVMLLVLAALGQRRTSS